MTAKRAAIYARVSTAEQVDGTSLATQVAQCERYAALQEWGVQGSYVDEGVSGAKARRPALDRLLREVEQGNVEVVVVAKLDRIGRSMRHLAALLGQLDDAKVALVSVSEAFDSATAAGRLQRNMLGSFAEFEREQIRDRLSSGRDATVRNGKYVSTHAPYGLAIDTEGGQRRLVIDPVEAETLRVAIGLYVNQKLTTGQVAAELNARGHRPRHAARWHGHLVRSLLRNADHISGTWTWRHARHRYQAPPIAMAVPALVDPTTHERLRARLGETTRQQTGPVRGRRSERYLLAGRIRTPHGTLMYGLHNPSAVYRCSEVFATNAPPHGRTCDCRPIRAEHVDDAVWSEVCALLSDPARLSAMAGLRLEKGQATVAANQDDLTTIDRRISRLEKAAGEQLSRLLVDGLDPAVASHTAQSLSSELAILRRRRAQVAAWQTANAEQQNRAAGLASLASRAREILSVADLATKQRILALLAVEVKITGWQPCTDCGGVGYISRPTMSPLRPGRNKGNADKICRTCRRHRWLPQIVIEGTVPEADLDSVVAENDGTARWPFTLVAGDR
jgi:site-specific DNA recombinase